MRYHSKCQEMHEKIDELRYILTKLEPLLPWSLFEDPVALSCSVSDRTKLIHGYPVTSMNWEKLFVHFFGPNGGRKHGKQNRKRCVKQQKGSQCQYLLQDLRSGGIHE
jgi:hypothetical protein